MSPLVDNNPENWLYTAAPVLLQPLASARTSTTTSVTTGRPLVCWGSRDVSSVSYWWAESVSTHWRISPGRPSVRVTQWRCVAKIGKTGSGDFLACSEHPVLLTWQSSAQLGNGWPSFPVWRDTLASSEGFPPDAQRTSQSSQTYAAYCCLLSSYIVQWRTKNSSQFEVLWNWREIWMSLCCPGWTKSVYLAMASTETDVPVRMCHSVTLSFVIPPLSAHSALKRFLPTDRFTWWRPRQSPVCPEQCQSGQSLSSTVLFICLTNYEQTLTGQTDNNSTDWFESDIHQAHFDGSFCPGQVEIM